MGSGIPEKKGNNNNIPKCCVIHLEILPLAPLALISQAMVKNGPCLKLTQEKQSECRSPILGDVRVQLYGHYIPDGCRAGNGPVHVQIYI